MEKILSWGKCSLEAVPKGGGAKVIIPTPKEGSVKLSTQAGEEHLAKEEGGGVVARKVGKNVYTLEFDLFVAAGDSRPFEDVDGVINGEYSITCTPEDPKATGFSIERASISCEENYNTADGYILHYVAKCLRPESGKTIKEVKGKSVPGSH